MTEDQFWDITQKACQSDPKTAEDWNEFLIEQLSSLTPDEVIAWDRHFERLTAAVYRVDMWCAAYLINGGASDDGFYYFRCWLVGMGKDIYYSAWENPDNLAGVASPSWWEEGIDAEAEIYLAARYAWMQITGNDDDSSFPPPIAVPELTEPFWDFEDHEETGRRLPRLSKLFSESR